MADITATLTGQVTITGDLTVPMGIVPRGELEINENGEFDVTNYETAQVTVPQPSGSVTITENGEHDVTDYVTADVQVPQPSGSIEITENGTFDVTDFVQAMVNVESRGITNAVAGEFTATADTGKTQEIDLPYYGSGYPIAMVVFVKEGMSAPSTTWRTVAQRYASGVIAYVKANILTPPAYVGTSEEQDKCSAFYAFKASVSTYAVSATGAIPSDMFRQNNGYGQSGQIVFPSATKMLVRVTDGNAARYGVQKNVTYKYIVLYSE